ncbi:hypothetical protein FQU78_00715 [Methanosarcina mazei]|uniref:Uncharacterized protein n=1 Tax=Methanosarcina mazei TaxID=2209 RepID=A0A6C0VEV3_METMZ|nr:hypothetical protein FQU78_00715 [Methanosarcina mazei]
MDSAIYFDLGTFLHTNLFSLRDDKVYSFRPDSRLARFSSRPSPVSGGRCPSRVSFREHEVLFARFARSRGLILAGDGAEIKNTAL